MARSMTTAQKNYAQIDQIGRKVVVETDHQPLIAISKKQLCDAPPRLQHLLLHIQKYDLMLEYTPGKLLVVADTLSRSFSSKEVASTTDSEVHIHFCAVKSSLPVSERKWAELAEETKNDREVRVICSMADGSDICPKPYVTFIDELTIVDGVILKGQRVIVPENMRAEMLQLIHKGHLGIEKCKRQARDILYWPNTNKDVYDTVTRCDVCQEYRYAQQQKPLQMHERPDRPWGVGSMRHLLPEASSIPTDGRLLLALS